MREVIFHVTLGSKIMVQVRDVKESCTQDITDKIYTQQLVSASIYHSRLMRIGYKYYITRIREYLLLPKKLIYILLS